MPIIRELNLLPYERRKELAKQAFLTACTKVFRNIAYSFVGVTIMGIAAIVMIEALVFAADTSAETRLSQAVDRYAELRQEIAEQNQTVELLHTQQESRVVWSDVLENLFQMLPSGVGIVRMDANIQPEPLLTFRGIAINRNILIVTNDRLNQQEWVKEVVAPQTNLLQKVNSPYIFQVHVKTADMEDAKKK